MKIDNPSVSCADSSLYTREPMTRRGCHYIKKPIYIVSLSYRANEASDKSAKAKKALYDFFRVQTKQKHRQSRLCAAVKSDLSYIFCFYGGNCFSQESYRFFPRPFAKSEVRRKRSHRRFRPRRSSRPTRSRAKFYPPPPGG